MTPTQLNNSSWRCSFFAAESAAPTPTTKKCSFSMLHKVITGISGKTKSNLDLLNSCSKVNCVVASEGFRNQEFKCYRMMWQRCMCWWVLLCEEHWVVMLRKLAEYILSRNDNQCSPHLSVQPALINHSRHSISRKFDRPGCADGNDICPICSRAVLKEDGIICGGATWHLCCFGAFIAYSIVIVIYSLEDKWL